MSSLHILFASTSGHTEYVVDVLMSSLEKALPSLAIHKQRAESATPEDLLTGDFLILATGTWNTGGVEGQLNPYMHALLKEKAKNIDLGGKKCAVISLGDHRYRYTCGSAAHAEEYLTTHGGDLAAETLKIVNEPYGQEKKVEEWAARLIPLLA